MESINFTPLPVVVGATGAVALGIFNSIALNMGASPTLANTFTLAASVVVISLACTVGFTVGSWASRQSGEQNTPNEPS